jgi:1,4-dihydroxy-6-naphthoate synthase
MKTLSVGYSPCPNDTFIFYAMTHGKVDQKNLAFKVTLSDVETLNQKAINTDLDITKISYHAFGHVHKNYCLLRSGGAIGRGCGPLIVARNEYTMEELMNKKIAIPGTFTTAYLLLQLYNTAFIGGSSNPRLIVMPFQRIMDSVARGEVDAGLIIHEGRFTYKTYGLRQIIDLGEWWERETGLPIPLGGIIAKRSLGHGLNKKINKIIRASIEYAMNNRDEPMDYIKKYSQELSEDVIHQHIELYVNKFSLDIGDEGEKAIKELLSRAENTGIIKKIKQNVFY